MLLFLLLVIIFISCFDCRHSHNQIILIAIIACYFAFKPTVIVYDIYPGTAVPDNVNTDNVNTDNVDPADPEDSGTPDPDNIHIKKESPCNNTRRMVTLEEALDEHPVYDTADDALTIKQHIISQNFKISNDIQRSINVNTHKKYFEEELAEHEDRCWWEVDHLNK